MKRKDKHISVGILCIIMCTVCFAQLSHLSANADSGPHPSIFVSFDNLGDRLCYGTLLSDDPFLGPLHAYLSPESPRSAFIDDNYYHDLTADSPESDIWQAFVDFNDSDGFFFLKCWINLNNTKMINWQYWAPDRFKILLYYPESNSYAVSGICERYAYESYYTVDMEKTDFSVPSGGEYSVAFITSVEKTYPYPWGKELLSLLARTCITVALEVGIALLFRLRQKKVLLIIVIANVITQLLLNVALNVYAVIHYTFSFIDFYLQLEVCVFVIEAILYCLLLNRYTEKAHKQAYYVAYSLAANVVSFLAGVVLAYVVPGIF